MLSAETAEIRRARVRRNANTVRRTILIISAISHRARRLLGNYLGLRRLARRRLLPLPRKGFRHAGNYGEGDKATPRPPSPPDNFDD